MGTEMVMQRLPGVDRENVRQSNTGNDHGQGDPVVEAENEVLRQLNSAAPKRHHIEQMQRFAGLGIGLSSVFAENLLSHPCNVLRRQCQVHHHSAWYHLTPFTLFPVMYHMQSHQTIATLWKGIGSTFVVKGIGLATEAAISEFTPCPREVNRHSTLKKLGQHLILKGVGFLVITPFFSASLIETVQSEIASEKPGLLDCVKEGFVRMSGLAGTQSTRLLPMWKLVVPTMSHGLSHYIIKSVAQYTVLLAVRTEMQEDYPHEDPPPVKSMYDRYFPELLATFTGGLLADMVLFPIETVLHRLHVQGTRTIIDNTDTGLGVVPINTRYEGFIDCFRSILYEEGFAGLYKGFGALMLQYTIHALILKLTKFLFEQLTDDFEGPRQRHTSR
ncbi:mitochondrial outer membrane protein SLC25A46-like [Lineus longissimus]|uniref:mitochondrial outer membrane protein SLC25A46-like n=1 Tax=Lineus longissimus TaxID=88925 RepID=UPI002B4EF864